MVSVFWSNFTTETPRIFTEAQRKPFSDRLLKPAVNKKTESTSGKATLGKILMTFKWVFRIGLVALACLTVAGHAHAQTKTEGVLICDGDSLTQGIGSTYNYPMQLDSSLSAAHHRFVVINAGVGGRTVRDMGGSAAENVDSRFQSGGLNILVFWGGTNDIAVDKVNGDSTYQRIKSYLDDRRSLGWKIIVLTITRRSDFSGIKEAARQAANRRILANCNSIADACIDVAAEPLLANPGDSRYFRDGIHLTDEGYKIVAEAVKPAVIKLATRKN